MIECTDSGSITVVELPRPAIGSAIQPLDTARDDDLINELLVSTRVFLEMVSSPRRDHARSRSPGSREILTGADQSDRAAEEFFPCGPLAVQSWAGGLSDHDHS